MNKVRLFAAVLLALPLVLFGSNYFLKFSDLPPGDGEIGDQLLMLMRDGGLMSAVALSHVVIGIMLFVPQSRFVAGLLQLPISLGILAFHATMLPAGNIMAILMVILNVLVIAEEKKLTALLRNTS